MTGHSHTDDGNCPYCSSDSTRVTLIGPDYLIYECSRCGSEFEFDFEDDL